MKLNRQQREIIELASEGLSDEGISERTNYSLPAVRASLREIYKKYGINKTHGINRRICAVNIYRKEAENE